MVDNNPSPTLSKALFYVYETTDKLSYMYIVKLNNNNNLFLDQHGSVQLLLTTYPKLVNTTVRHNNLHSMYQ